jgi:dTDP-4-dehydrorhamnose 3,5-epimerase-like enzyme
MTHQKKDLFSKVIKNVSIEDRRGIFSPVVFDCFNAVQMSVVTNPSITIRGLHAQTKGFEQAKLVTAISGALIDFVFDGEGGYDYAVIGEKCENRAVVVPPGLLHGYITLESNTTVAYLLDSPYSKESEVAVSPLHHDISQTVSELYVKLLVGNFDNVSDIARANIFRLAIDRGMLKISDKDKVVGYSVEDFRRDK